MGTVNGVRVVKSETLFNRIAGSGVLLSAGAIIPSYSAFRHQLVSQLTQLQRLLQEERCPPQESSTLCHLLGGYLDIYLQKYRLQQGILVADPPGNISARNRHITSPYCSRSSIGDAG